jgi:hypothetical protein
MAVAWGAWAAATSNPPARASDGLRRPPGASRLRGPCGVDRDRGVGIGLEGRRTNSDGNEPVTPGRRLPAESPPIQPNGCRREEDAAGARRATGSQKEVGDEVADAVLQREVRDSGALRHRGSVTSGGRTARLEGGAGGASIDSAKRAAQLVRAGSARWRSGRQRVGPLPDRERERARVPRRRTGARGIAGWRAWPPPLAA